MIEQKYAFVTISITSADLNTIVPVTLRSDLLSMGSLNLLVLPNDPQSLMATLEDNKIVFMTTDKAIIYPS